MYTVYFINFGYGHEADTIELAKLIAVRAGFESAVYSPDKTLVATYSPLSGWSRR